MGWILSLELIMEGVMIGSSDGEVGGSAKRPQRPVPENLGGRQILVLPRNEDKCEIAQGGAFRCWRAF